QQPRYNFSPCVTDATGLHWCFIYGEDIKLIDDVKVRVVVTRHPFRLNPFCYHKEYNNSPNRSFYGGHIIMSRYLSDLKTWLKNNYPEYVKRIYLDDGSKEIRYGKEEELVPIFDAESVKAPSVIREAVDRVWNELRDLEDINPLGIIQ
ncbi:unnamed protein product, partial [Didymodactylos carnosus]